MDINRPIDTLPAAAPMRSEGNIRSSATRSSRTLDWVMALISAWIIAGLFLDGWYHNTFTDSIETFFTPWHAVLYSGLLAASLALGSQVWLNRRNGATWINVLPHGYALSLLGCVIFAAGGGVDLAWHTLFGFEADVEALLSPAHLVLATGGALLVSGPLRAYLARGTAPARNAWADVLPALLSLLALLSIFTFFTQFSNLYAHPSLVSEAAPAGSYHRYLWDVTLLSYVLVPAVITMIFVFFAIRNLALPAGGLTLLLVPNTLLMFGLGAGRGEAPYGAVVLAALAGAATAELCLLFWKRSLENPGWLHLLAFAQPFVTTLVYFLILIALHGISWRIHMWLGAPVLAGMLGLMLWFLLLPASGTLLTVEAPRENR